MPHLEPTEVMTLGVLPAGDERPAGFVRLLTRHMAELKELADTVPPSGRVQAASLIMVWQTKVSAAISRLQSSAPLDESNLRQFARLESTMLIEWRHALLALGAREPSDEETSTIAVADVGAGGWFTIVAGSLAIYVISGFVVAYKAADVPRSRQRRMHRSWAR